MEKHIRLSFVDNNRIKRFKNKTSTICWINILEGLCCEYSHSLYTNYCKFVSSKQSRRNEDEL